MEIKAQRRINLSSSEVEWGALSEAVKEVIFDSVAEMLTVDNVGAILVAGNITATSCTKHVDIRYKYVSKM